MRVFLLPTWLLYLALRPLLSEEHPWKRPVIGFTRWCDHATELLWEFGFTFSTILITMLFLGLLAGWRIWG